MRRKIPTLLKLRSEWPQIAKNANTSVGYINQVAYGYSKVSPDMAKRLEAATDGRVHRSDLLPEVWEPQD